MKWVQPKCPSCGAQLRPVDPLHPRVTCDYCRSSFDLSDAAAAYRSDGQPVDLQALARMVADELAARNHAAWHQTYHHAAGGHHATTVRCMTCGRYNWPHHPFCFGCGLSLPVSHAHAHAAAAAAPLQRAAPPPRNHGYKTPLWQAFLTIPFLVLALVIWLLDDGPPPEEGPLCDDGECKFVQLSSGTDFTCGLTESGDVYCWGSNVVGQLGRRTDLRFGSAGRVHGLNGPVMSLGSSLYRSCAVLRRGHVNCWGADDGRQPRFVRMPARVVAVTLGTHHTCALTRDDRVTCWGNNEFGQAGRSDVSDDAPPTHLFDASDEIAQVSAGGDHACALTKTGAVECWGRNDRGQLGDGTTEASAVPVGVEGLPGKAVSIAVGGEHSCAVLEDGSAMCWGSDEYGQLGHGRQDDETEAVALEGISMMSAGVHHTCALTRKGEIYCWGRNENGQVGDGTTEPRRTPTPVSPLGTRAVSVEAGHHHSCAIMGTGGVQCWGLVEAIYRQPRLSPEWVVRE